MSRIDANRAESLDNQDPTKDTDGDKKPKSKRPANTAFRQQRLKAWQPILNPKSVLPLFFVVGVIFAPIGGVLLWASSQVQELAIDYSECSDKAPTGPSSSQMPGDKYTSTFKSSAMDAPFWQRNTTDNTTCILTFSIPESMGPPVFMYYRLTNFYQNHRRYVQSMYLDQMKGKAVENKTIKGSTCEPLTIDPDTQKAYYPCGLIANSMFNDTINSPWQVGSVNGEVEYTMTNKGIAWESDKEIIKKTEYKPWEVVPPQNWRERFPNGYTEEQPIPDLGQDEDFMVWMRTAALPTFSKLARRNDTTELAPGNYRLSIQDRFPVTEYGGEKWILISTRTVIGGKNPFMGIAYVVVGGTCVLLGTLFTIAHLVRPRKLGDHTYLTWNNDQDSSAIASGRDQRLGAQAS